MRAVISILLLTSAVNLAWAERSEMVWEQQFDVGRLSEDAWRLEGDAVLRDGALWTRSVLEGPVSSYARGLREARIPGPRDPYMLRVEWALVPLQGGDRGQSVHVAEGLFVVEFTEKGPVLNREHAARDAVRAGEVGIVSCDFNDRYVFDWRINGRPQLGGPVPAWQTGAATARIDLGDRRGGGSETKWLWVRLSRVYPEDTLALRLSGWDDLPQVTPDQPSSYLIGQASPMEKVFREAAAFKGSFGSHVQLAAAGRERESFQLVVMPLRESLRGVQVEVSDLLHEDGQTRLPAGRVNWYRVGYVQTQPSDSALRRVGWWWPDVLLLPEPFDVEPGFVQPVWFTVDVPAEAQPGVYRALITLRAQGTDPQHVGIELTVRPFSLPLRGKLKTAFSFNPGVWAMWYRPEETRKRLGLSEEADPWDAFVHLNSCPNWADLIPWEKRRELYDFLLAHRLNPTTIGGCLKEGQTQVVPSREDMEYCYQRGMNATCLGYVDNFTFSPSYYKRGEGQEAESKESYLRDLVAWLADWDHLIREKDWKDFTWYVHGFDESDWRDNPEQTVDPDISLIYGRMGEMLPHIRRESANPPNPVHVGLFDIWTPITSNWTPAFRERQQAGDEVWAYVCCAPLTPYANLHLECPGVDPRILPWQCYQHGATGFLYWTIDYYVFQENWNRAAPKWPERPWNTVVAKTNGDGVLIYPGPDATPLASTRLENLRDGIEDYEALAMLAELTARLESIGAREELVRRAEAAISVRPEMARSWTEYTKDPEVIFRARAEVDSLIEAMLQELGKP